MQLVAYGAQDVYLSGNPQITFFKVVYRRHTNFAVEPIQQTWNGAADFGRTVTCNINRNGDLITNMHLAVRLNAVDTNSVAWGFVNRLGHAMVQSCKVEIGGSKIDEQYGDWLNVWYELSHKVGQERGYANMIGDVAHLRTMATSAKRAFQMYVPLQFWFNRNNGLALPLIALQYHDVRVTVQFRDLASCVNYVGSTAPSLSAVMGDSYLLIDYVYLDSEERKRFAQSTHEYLIEQLQFTGAESLTATSNKYRLNFNHPCKFLAWVPHLERHATRSQWLAWADNGDWNAARDRFAKVLAVACSAGLAFTPATPVITATVTTAGASDVVAAGDIVEPVRAVPSGVLAGVSGMLSKIEVKFVNQTSATASTNTATVTLAKVGATASALLEEALNNAIVVRNELTMEDLTNTVAQLTGTNTGEPSEVLSASVRSVVNHFNYGNWVDGSDNPVLSAKLQLNGHDRFQARDGSYFNFVQPWQHFSNTPADGVNVYSFALKPEEHQPSGTCNFSRIDNATLQVDLGTYNVNSTASNIGSSSNSTLNIYTVNYNVLRVMSGMAGTAYSN